MLELKALLLTQGMHGMISQVEGLAKALKLSFKHKEIKLKPLWNLIPPKLTPISENLLTEKFVCDSKIIISCGRKSVIPSIALKKRFGKDIFNIHIQDPKVSYNHFDLIISPEHDKIEGNNVITTKGAIHYLTKKEISQYSDYLDIKKDKKQLVAFIIGGPNKYFKFTDEEISDIFNKVKTLFTTDKYKIVVIPSYRTPERVIKKANEAFGFNHLVIKTIDKKAYLSSLSISDYIVVTCDSTSMISEAAVTGKPIYVADIPANKNDHRIKKFRDLFTKLNIIKKLNDKLETWHYETLNEASRIANEIKKELS